MKRFAVTAITAFAFLGTITLASAASYVVGQMPGQPNFSPKWDMAQAATPKPATSTCAKRNNACSGTCVGADNGKSCGAGGVQMSGCICK
jgi:hypothetical protein